MVKSVGSILVILKIKNNLVIFDNCDIITDLKYGVNRVDEFSVDLFILVHFDKAYDSYDGVLGHRCWTYSNEGEA